MIWLEEGEGEGEGESESERKSQSVRVCIHTMSKHSLELGGDHIYCKVSP